MKTIITSYGSDKANSTDISEAIRKLLGDFVTDNPDIDPKIGLRFEDLIEIGFIASPVSVLDIRNIYIQTVVIAAELETYQKIHQVLTPLSLKQFLDLTFFHIPT